MSLLFRVIYATHANGTHHKLALDSLNRLQDENAEKWLRLFLKHAELFIQGSKAPDKEFKDFRNHVLHPGDDYWGGAPEKCRGWYTHLVDALKEQNWSEAVWCAGVLSHYYTDPIHPFHTAQSDAENAIHRAVEWSINRSYNALYKLGCEHAAPVDITLGDNETWVEDLVCDGADTSHEQYERLIAHYDINVGVSDPPGGLDVVAQNLIAQLLVYATTGFSKILDRAFKQADVTPPDVDLSLDTFLATLKIPLKWVERKLDDAADKATVRAMYDELMSTGRVEENLPEDDRAVRALHAKEVIAPRQNKRKKARKARLAATRKARNARKTKPAPKVTKPQPESADAKALSSLKPRIETPAASPHASTGDANATATAMAAALTTTGTSFREQPEHTPERAAAHEISDTAHNDTAHNDTAPPSEVDTPETIPETITALESTPTQDVEPTPVEGTDATDDNDDSIHADDTEDTAARANPRIYLETGDPLERAPAIGPKTAARLATVGLLNVNDLLRADAEEISKKVSKRHITASVIKDWKNYARLVMSVPGLRGTHAQLLAGAGYKTADAIAEADPAKLSADVLQFAASKEGNRILRDGTPPDIEKIKSWVTNAAQALAA